MAVKTNNLDIDFSTIETGSTLSVKKENALNFTGKTLSDLSALAAAISGKNLVLTYGGKTVNILNYSKLKYVVTTDGTNDIISSDVIKNTIDFVKNINLKSGVVSGFSQYADIIDVSSLINAIKIKKDKKGNVSEIGVTIKSGKGGDIITGSKFNDAITAGLGNNTTIVKNETFGDDTITLTKGENLTLDMSAYTALTSSSDFRGKVKISGNNLLITTDNGTLTLKNFAKSNVAGDKGSVKIKLSDETYVDLNEDKVLTRSDSAANNEFKLNTKKKTATFQGSRFSEIITVSDEALGYTKTVKAGYGDDTITAGKGNDKIYTQYGNNAIILNSDDGFDTLYSGKGNDTIQFSDFTTLDSLKSDIKLSMKGKSLTLRYSDGDSVAISNYKANLNKITLSDSNSNTISLSDFITYYESNYQYETTGTNGNDKITISDNQEVYLFGGSDTVIFKGNYSGSVIYSMADIQDSKVINTDTLVFSDFSMNSDNYDFDFYRYNSATGIVSDTGTDFMFAIFKSSVYESMEDDSDAKDLAEKYVIYNDFFSGNDTPDLVVKDKSGNAIQVSYNSSTAELDWSKSKYNHLAYIDADKSGSSKVSIISSKKENGIISYGTMGLEFTSVGGIDDVISYGNSDDTYNINSFTSKTNMVIEDHDGDNDVINFNTGSSNFRIFFNCNSDGSIEDNNIYFVYKDIAKNSAKLLNTLKGFEYNDSPAANGVIHITSAREDDDTDLGTAVKIEKIITTDYSSGINMDTWMNKIKSDVAGWLSDNSYDSVWDVIETASTADAKAVLAFYNQNYTSAVNA